MYLSWITYGSHQYQITDTVSNFSLTVRSCDYWNDLSKIDRRLSLYFTAIAFLHVSRKIETSVDFSEQFMDVLATIVGVHVRTVFQSEQQCCVAE